MNESWFELKEDHVIVHREPPKVKGQLVGYFAHPDGRPAERHRKNPLWPANMVCLDCRTQFHVDIQLKPVCNGAQIELCPWCREDSKPWKNGRGI